jgi:hypothetical protein
MMERGIGYNVSLSYLDKDTRAWVEAYIRDAKPATMLMFDTNGDEAVYVKWLARTFPDTIFEYRLWIPEETNPNNGDNQQLYLSAAAWVEKHRAFAGTRVYCTVNNEPNHGDVTRTCKWHIDVMKRAHAAGIRTAIGGYAYGHPNNGPLDPANPDNWKAIYGPFDEQMRAVAAAGDMALVDVHCYGNDRLRDAVPYLIGRYKFWQAHLAREGIGPTYWIIGEHGWATIEADDRPEYWLFFTIVNGWRSPDWQADMAGQLQDIWRTEYGNNPYVVGANLFTLSTYSWPRSSYIHAPRARELLSKGFETMAVFPPQQTTPTVDPYPVGPRVLNITNPDYDSINLRGADGAILAEIPDGVTLTVIAPDTARMLIAGRWYDVQKVRYGTHEGVIALTSTFKLEPVTPAPDRYAALAAQCRATSAVLRAEADKLDAIATEAEAL